MEFYKKDWPCGGCGSKKAFIHKKRGEQHLTCADCDTYFGCLPISEKSINKQERKWTRRIVEGISKKKKPRPKSRPKSHRKLVSKIGLTYCEICLASEEDITNRDESLEAHHVIPFVLGGSSKRENIWILCSSCHEIVEWRRLQEERKRQCEEET